MKQQTTEGASRPAPELSPSLRETLVSALREWNPELSASDDVVRREILSLVTEARQRGWRPEETAAALRAAEGAADQAAKRPAGERDALQNLLRRRVLVAYFGGDASHC